MQCDKFCFISAIWVNHDFGYDTYLPNVIIDNFKMSSNVKAAAKTVEIFCLTNGSTLDNKNDPVVDGERVRDYEEDLLNEDYRQSTLYHEDGTTKTNLNPYKASDFIIIKNDYEQMNYVSPTHIVFENTSFKKLPLPFDNIDTPVIPYNK